jgi:hypothetical protein
MHGEGQVWLAVDNKQKMIEEPTSYCCYLHHNISTKVYINDIICIASSFLALITVHWVFFFKFAPPLICLKLRHCLQHPLKTEISHTSQVRWVDNHWKFPLTQWSC